MGMLFIWSSINITARPKMHHEKCKNCAWRSLSVSPLSMRLRYVCGTTALRLTSFWTDLHHLPPLHVFFFYRYECQFVADKSTYHP